VLVADDDLSGARHYMSIGWASGLPVLISARPLRGRAREPLLALHANPVDVVLLDVRMPKLDGYGVLTERGRTPSVHRASVILVSGGGDDDAVMRGLTAGAEDYLPKPFAPTAAPGTLSAFWPAGPKKSPAAWRWAASRCEECEKKAYARRRKKRTERHSVYRARVLLEKKGPGSSL
jgi:PleD family two-component response regulator